MTTSSHNTKYSVITRMLDDYRLNESIHELENQKLSPDMTDRLREASTIYTQLLHFFATGVPDPSRSDQLAAVREMLYCVADSLRRDSEMETSSALYYSRLRIARMSSTPTLSANLADIRNLLPQLSLADLTDTFDEALHARLDEAISRLFYSVWVNQCLSRREASEILNFLTDGFDDEPAYLQAVASLISALTLSSMEYFDAAKLLMLLQVVERDRHAMLTARALIGAVLIIGRHPRRSADNPEIRAISQAIAEREGFNSLLRALVTAMLRTRDTDRVNRKLRDEIIPDIIKLKPEIEKRLRSANPEELTSMEENPEWMEMIEKSGAGEKLREFSEMQLQGADVFMGAFAGMKNFAFFRDLPNWFLPFSMHNSRVHSALKDAPSGLAEIMLDIPLFCSSDKFSLAFSLSRMPKAQADLMSSQMQSQFAALSEEQRATLSETLRSTRESEMTIYLKDLFRFHRLWEGRSEFFDPFSRPFTVPDHPLFAGAATDSEMLRLMADFYFTNRYWSDAAPLYGRLAEQAIADSADAEKQGYCLEKSGNVADALEAYRQAELMCEPSKWLLKRIAYCLRATGQYAQAATYYSRALEKEPDNLRLELLKAHSLLEAGMPADALKSYYKVDYLDPDSGSATRGAAWCEFLLGNYDKSHARYEAITAREDATASDHLNYGHVLLAEEKITEAAACYKRMAAMTDRHELLENLRRDRATLLAAGIPPLTLTLIAEL